MANLKVNTDVVVNVANKIKTRNTNLRNEFADVRTAIQKLDGSWNGEAAACAMAKFREIDATYSDARYNVLNNHVNFLLQQVGEGYEQTESVNKSLAEQFK